MLQTILVFLNNILQEPGVAYRFNGGSNLTFTEPPKVGDTCSILFYRGTGAVDVISEILLKLLNLVILLRLMLVILKTNLNLIKIKDL